MFRPLAVFVGLRYVHAKRRSHFISVISMFSMLGIAVGIWALITVLSVMNGFEKELKSRILDMTPHASIIGFMSPLQDWRKVVQIARKHPHVVAAAPYIRGQAMINKGSYSSGVFIRGIMPKFDARVSRVSGLMIYGKLTDLKPHGYGIILGAELAEQLLGRKDIGAIPPEDRKVTVIIPKTTITPAGVIPRFRRFTVVGVFEAGVREYDSGLAMIHMEDAARLYRLKGGVTGVRLKVDDMFRAAPIGQQLIQQLDGSYGLETWQQKHSNLFYAMNLEKKVMFIILFLIVAVAAFNIVSTLVMMVTDKQADIAILRTLGATPGTIMGVFIMQGSIIGVIGTLLGLLTGVPTALNVEAIVSTLEKWLGSTFLPSDVFYISKIRGDMQWDDVLVICGVSLLLTVLATLYPAWRAARTQPAEALRYE
jgi:lipoprotein-releasing system permease protein